MVRKGNRRANYLPEEDSYPRFSFEVRDFGVEGTTSYITLNVREFQEENRLVEIRTVYSWSQLRNFLRSYRDDLDKGESEIISRFIQKHLPTFPKTSLQVPVKYLDQAVPIGDKSLKTRLAIESAKERAQPEKVEVRVPEARKLRGSSAPEIEPSDNWYYSGYFGQLKVGRA